MPEPAWIGKWALVYDPRKDSTYPGGSGTHRALVETTYEWSRNPALHALTWALGRWQNGKKKLGIGAPIANIRVADFVEAANVADENDWYCGGVEWSTDAKWSTLKRMLQAGGAEPTMTGAMIGCRVNTPRIPIAVISAGDLLDSASFPTTKSRRDRFNTVIPRYRSEDHDWEVISGSEVSVAAYVTEDRGKRTKEIDFPLVQAEVGQGFDGHKQAGQLAAYEIVNSREAGPWRITVGPAFIGLKTGDAITLDVPDEGFGAKLVLIRKRSIDPATFQITFEVETETFEKHAYALGETTVPPPTFSPTPPNLVPPQPKATLWSLADGATAEGLPALIVAGACEFPAADSVLIEYRKLGEGEWISRGKFEASAPVRHIIAPVDGAAIYQARVAYQSGNRIGPWRDLVDTETPSWDAPESAISAYLTTETINLPASPTGVVSSYGAAAGQFRVYQGSVDVSSLFALSTLANPQGLTVGYTGQAYAVTGGFDAGEDTASLLIRATGSGTFAGVTLDKVLTLGKSKAGAPGGFDAEQQAAFEAVRADLDQVILDQAYTNLQFNTFRASTDEIIQTPDGNIREVIDQIGALTDEHKVFITELKRVDPVTGQSLLVLSANADGKIAGLRMLAGASGTSLDFMAEIIRLWTSDGITAQQPFVFEDAVLTAPEIVVDRLKVNTAAVPVRVAATTPLAGGYGSTAGTPTPVSRMQVSIVMPTAGWIEVNASLKQGFTSGTTSRPWIAQIVIAGAVLPESVTGGTVPGDSVVLQGSTYVEPGEYLIELFHEAHTSINLEARSMFAKGFPFT